VPKTHPVADPARRSVVGLGLSGLAASLIRAPVARAASLTDGIDNLLDVSASAYGTVGYSVAVLRRGKLVHARHAGLADLGTGAPITDRSVYPIFSISKLFLVVELLKAQARGLIDLGARLGEIRSGLPATWSEITLAQALAHVSGLPDYIPDHVKPTADQTFAAIASLPLRFAPGTRNDYNQTNFLLAKEALEKATQTPLTTLVGRQFRAAGMKHAAYAEVGVSSPGQVTTYQPSATRDRSPVAFIPAQWPSYTHGSGGVCASLADMVAWSQSLLRGDLLPLAPLQASWRPFLMPDGGAAWHTHGWEYYRHGDVTIIGHGGGVRLVWRHVFRTADPADCATVIYLDNGGRTTFDRHRLATLMADRVLPGAARIGEDQEEALYRGLASNQWDGAIASVDATVPVDRLEAIVNRVGYDAMSLLDASAALPAFQWNAKRFVQSSNAHDSLGEAYHVMGRLDQARESYQHALALEPSNARIKAVLQKLDRPTLSR